MALALAPASGGELKLTLVRVVENVSMSQSYISNYRVNRPYRQVYIHGLHKSEKDTDLQERRGPRRLRGKSIIVNSYLLSPGILPDGRQSLGDDYRG